MREDFDPWAYRDPMDDYVRDVDGKMRSRYEIEKRKQEHITAITEAAIQRQLHPEIAQREREEAIMRNPLLSAPPKERKVPRSLGGLHKCYICNHPHRAKIEADYQGSGGNALKVHRDIIAAGGKVSIPAVYNHFKRHYQAPGAPAPAQGQP